MWLSVAKTSFCKSRTSLTSSRSVVFLIIFLIFLSVLSGSIFGYCTKKWRFDSLGSAAGKYYWSKEQWAEQWEEQLREQVYLWNRIMFGDTSPNALQSCIVLAGYRNIDSALLKSHDTTVLRSPAVFIICSSSCNESKARNNVPLLVL